MARRLVERGFGPVLRGQRCGGEDEEEGGEESGGVAAHAGESQRAARAGGSALPDFHCGGARGGALRERDVDGIALLDAATGRGRLRDDGAAGAGGGSGSAISDKGRRGLGGRARGGRGCGGRRGGGRRFGGGDEVEAGGAARAVAAE